jgi:hypothetical protein
LSNPVVFDSILERLNNRFLADHLLESLGSIFSGINKICHFLRFERLDKETELLLFEQNILSQFVMNSKTILIKGRSHRGHPLHFTFKIYRMSHVRASLF